MKSGEIHIVMASAKFDFSGHTVAVTGAASGIGKGIASALLKNSADKVVVIDKNADALAQFCSEHGNDKRIVQVVGDLSNEAEINRISSCFDEHAVNMLVNNAGFLNPEANLADLQFDNFDKLMNVNLRAAIFMTRNFADSFGKRYTSGCRKSGSIVNISSIGSMAIVPRQYPYSISKAALDKFMKMSADELGRKWRIRVNNVNPGGTLTPLLASFLAENPGAMDSVKAKNPMGQINEIEHVVGPVLFLLSDAATMINGSNVCIDGGLHGCLRISE